MIYDPNMSTGSLYNCNDVSVSQPSTGGWWMLYLIITSDCQTPPSPPPRLVAGQHWFEQLAATLTVCPLLRAVASCGDMQQLSCVWLCRVQRPIMRRAMCLLNHVTSQSNHHTSHNHSQHSTAQHTDFLDDASSEINNFSRHRCVKRRGLAVLCI